MFYPSDNKIHIFIFYAEVTQTEQKTKQRKCTETGGKDSSNTGKAYLCSQLQSSTQINLIC